MNVAELGSKAGNFLSGKRVEGGGERDRKIDGRDRGEIKKDRATKRQRQRDRADNKNPEQSPTSNI